MKYKVGDRVEIVKAEGMTIGNAKLPLKDPHPEHIGKRGIIFKIDKDDNMPHIELDNGVKLLGCDCWWRKVK